MATFTLDVDRDDRISAPALCTAWCATVTFSNWAGDRVGCRMHVVYEGNDPLEATSWGWHMMVDSRDAVWDTQDRVVITAILGIGVVGLETLGCYMKRTMVEMAVVGMLTELAKDGAYRSPEQVAEAILYVAGTFTLPPIVEPPVLTLVPTA